MKKDSTKLFCDIDDFTQAVKKEMRSHQLIYGKSHSEPTRKPGLDESEIMTIIPGITLPKLQIFLSRLFATL